MKIIGPTEKLGKNKRVLKSHFGLIAIEVSSIEVGEYSAYFEPDRCCLAVYDGSGVRCYHILKNKERSMPLKEAEFLIEKLVQEDVLDLRKIGDYIIRIHEVPNSVSIVNKLDEDFEPSPIYVKVVGKR